MMDATTGFDTGAEQTSQVDPDALYAEFITRAGVLTPGALAGAGALISEIAMSALPLSMFEPLAAVIAEAIQGKKSELVEQMFKLRWTALGDTAAIPELPPDYRRLDAVPREMSEQQARMEMNARLAYVHEMGGQGVVLYFGPKTVEVRALKYLKEGLANCRVFVKSTDSKGAEKTTAVPAADWWHKHPQRRSYERTAFRPYRPYAPDGTPLPEPNADETEYNLWSGFEVTPQRGSWRLLRRHLLEVICRRDRRNFKYLLRLLAHRVQHPGESPHVVLVLLSEAEGTGKSLVYVVLERMIGQRHASSFSSPEELLGSYNEQLANQILIGLEETAFPGEHAMTRKLRAQITAGTWLINPKYLRPYKQPNMALIILNTNLTWAVHAGRKARRFCVFDTEEGHAGDATYFDPLWDEINHGGVEAMLYDLNRISLAGWNPQRDMPRTRALAKQQRLSANVYEKWAENVFLTDEFRPRWRIEPWENEHSIQEITEYVQEFARQSSIREQISSVGVGRWLSRCGFKRRESNGKTVWAIPSRIAFRVAVQAAAGGA